MLIYKSSRGGGHAETRIGEILEANGWKSRGGTNHEHFWKDGKMVMVKRHREIEDQTAKRILKGAGLR